MAGSKDKFESILDDEDVIKRLLMDDTFDAKNATVAAIDNIDPLFEQRLNKENSRIDQGEIDFKEIYDSVDTEAGIEQEVFSEMSEIDAFYENVIEPESNDNSGDDESPASTDEVDELVEGDFVSETESPNAENEAVEEEIKLDIIDSTYEEAVMNHPIVSQPVIDEINAQISQLCNDTQIHT